MRRLRVILAAVTAATVFHALLALGLSRIAHGQPVQLVAPRAPAAKADKPAPALAASPAPVASPAAPVAKSVLPVAKPAAHAAKPAAPAAKPAAPVEKMHARAVRSRRVSRPAALPVFDVSGGGSNVDDGGGSLDDAR